MKRVKKSNYILKVLLISIILSIIYELILKFIVKNNNTIYFYNLIIETGIISFVLLHFTIGFKNLYDLIVDNRFLLSIILTIVSTIVGCIGHVGNIKNFIIDSNEILSLVWNIKFYLLVLVSFELFLSFTDNRYISIVGTILIIFSGCVVWNPDIVFTIILGEFIVVLINNILKKEESINILLFSGILGIALLAYVNINPMASIPFGYVFIALIIWGLIKNKNNINIARVAKIFGITAIVYLILYFVIVKNIDVNKKIFKFAENENGIRYLFSYIFNIFLPYQNSNTKNVMGSFFSLFPVPMLMALYYVFNNEKHAEFLLPLTIASVIETIACLSGIPTIIKHILLFDEVKVFYIAMSVNYANLLLAFYMIANFDEKIFSIKAAMRITIITCCIIIVIVLPGQFGTLKKSTLYIIELAATIFLFLNFDDKKYKKVLMAILILIVLIGGVPANNMSIRDNNNNNKLVTSDEMILEK